MNDLKSGSNKTAATLWSSVLKEDLQALSLQRQLQIKFYLSMRQTILFSKIYQQSSRKFPDQNTDLFFWINKVSDVSFSISEQACLRCAGLHAAWHLSLGSYHTETHHFSPLLLRIKIIIVKFLLTITTLRMQSDCFGIKRSRKRPTDYSLQQTLPTFWRLQFIDQRWLKFRIFYHISTPCVIIYG